MRQRLNGGATWLGGTIRSILHAHLFQVVLIPTTSLRPSLLTIAGRRASKSCPTSSSGDGGRSITFPARTRIEARRAAALRSDNGPEFVAGTLLKWMADQGIEPRWSPRQALNGVAESFNGKLRDELSSLVWPDLSVSEGFVSRAGARVVIEAWRRETGYVIPSLTPSTDGKYVDVFVPITFRKLVAARPAWHRMGRNSCLGAPEATNSTLEGINRT